MMVSTPLCSSEWTEWSAVFYCKCHIGFFNHNIRLLDGKVNRRDFTGEKSASIR